MFIMFTIVSAPFQLIFNTPHLVDRRCNRRPQRQQRARLRCYGIKCHVTSQVIRQLRIDELLIQNRLVLRRGVEKVRDEEEDQPQR